MQQIKTFYSIISECFNLLHAAFNTLVENGIGFINSKKN